MLTLNTVAVAPEVPPVTVAVPEPDVAIRSDIADSVAAPTKVAGS